MSGEAIEIEYDYEPADIYKAKAELLARLGMVKSLAYLVCWRVFLLNIIKNILAIFFIFGLLFSVNFLSQDFSYGTFSRVFFYATSITFCAVVFGSLIFLAHLFTIRKGKMHQSLVDDYRAILNTADKEKAPYKCKVKFSNLGIFTRTQDISGFYQEGLFSWLRVRYLLLADGDLLVSFGNIGYFYIPARFFKSEEEKQRIYEQCLTWWQAAQEKPAESGAA